MNCSDNHLPLEKHLRAMVRKSGVLCGLPIIEVSGYTTNAMKCGDDLNHLSFTDLILKCIGTDACGRPAIRVKYIASCTLKMNCNLNDVSSEMNSIFAFDTATKSYALVLNKSV